MKRLFLAAPFVAPVALGKPLVGAGAPVKGIKHPSNELVAYSIG